MPIELSCDAVIFDMDGVLIDSSVVVHRHWSRWAAGYGMDPDYVLSVVHGRRPADSIRSLLPDIDNHDEIASQILAGEVGDTVGLQVLPGGAELIAQLPADAWTVATSAPRQIACERLAFAGIVPPVTMVAGEDVTQGKPAPDPYLLAAERIGIAPERCVVLEDAGAGVRAAKTAGARVVAVLTTHERAELESAGADWIVPNVAAVRLQNRRSESPRLILTVG